jgi:hypothetical protein
MFIAVSSVAEMILIILLFTLHQYNQKLSERYVTLYKYRYVTLYKYTMRIAETRLSTKYFNVLTTHMR